MELTSASGNEPETGTIRTTIVFIGVIWSKWRDCRCFTGDSRHPFRDIPVAQELYGPWLVGSGTSGRLYGSHRANSKDHYVGTSRCLAEYYVPNRCVYSASGQRTVSDTLTHLPAPGMLNPMGGC